METGGPVSRYKINPIRLPDGREVIGTLAAAYEIGVTPTSFPNIAKREGLQRFAKRNVKGTPSYYWLLTEVEDLRARRNGIEADIPFDTVVPLPYDDGDQGKA
jgi:hypothetical protein